MTESKKEWVTPELIVLVRSNPEEAVLSTCKNSGSEGSSGTIYGKCDTTLCAFCDNVFAS